LAAELLAAARQAHPRIDDHGLAALCGDGAKAADATGAPSLPPQWYAGRVPATA
jgi:hypothetical protein